MKYLPILLSFSLFSSIASAVLPSSVSDEEINQYIEQLGLKDTFESLPEQVMAIGQQQKLTSPTPEAVDSGIQAVMNVWDGDKALALANQHIRENTTEKQFSALVKWQNSALAKTMLGQELQATQPSFQSDLMHYMAVLQTNPPKQEVVSAVQNLVATTNMTEMTVELITTIMKSMAIASGEQETEKFNTMMVQMKPMLEGQMNQQMIMTSFYIYRNISADQLNEYTNFYKTELGKHELDLVWAAFSHAFSDWSTKVGEQLKDKKLAAK